MTYQSGLVSIIIPTYNRYELLHHSIHSCLNQTYKNIEIIVVNDCSTDSRYQDGTLEQFPKTTVIHLPINQRIKNNCTAAQGMTRQEGIKIAKGEWIAFLDDDDFFLPNKLEIQINMMTENNINFSSTNMYCIFHNEIDLKQLNFKIKKISSTYDSKENIAIITREMNKNSNMINNSGVILHRSIYDKLKGFNTGFAEDWNLWNQALEYSPCMIIDIPLVYYTMNSSKNYQY